MADNKHILTGSNLTGYTCIHCGKTWGRLNPVEILLTRCDPIVETPSLFGEATWTISDSPPLDWTEGEGQPTFWFKGDASPSLVFYSFSWGRDETTKTPADKGDDLLRQWGKGE